MGYTIRIHHPTLTEEERQARIENIKQAAIEFYREMQKQYKSKEAS